MRILDLYSGAGGAGVGYHRAGFEVVGVDINPQPHYPFDFVQAHALEYAGEHWRDFDAIHASPPCQRYTRLNRIKSIAQYTDEYEDMVDITRFVLDIIGLPYIIENVAGAPLRNSVMLCGSMFKGLRVYRHRFFESNILLLAPPHQPHKDKTPPVGRGISPKGFISVGAGGVANLPEGVNGAAYKRMAMGIDWMNQRELTEAIPPAYTEFLGRQLMRHIKNKQNIA